LIVAAAQLQHCAFLLTEDMQAGQNLGGVHVINPFAVAPGAATALLRRQRRARG
jgi:predicted nucleic acid-binding protein